MNFFQRLIESIRLWIELTKVSWQIMRGGRRLARLEGPVVTIFGGANLTQDNPYALKAQQVASLLLSHDISVITGGGSGIMRAASCVVTPNPVKARIIGIGVKSLQEERNECVQEFMLLDYLFARKWLMIHYAAAFIIFPGGFGTLDEMMEVITLMYTKEIPRTPIVLVGSDYWRNFLQWIKTDAVRAGLICPENIELFTVQDDVEAIVSLVQDYCQRPHSHNHGG